MAKSTLPALPPTPDDGFYRTVLRGIGAPITPNTMALIYAWRQTEGGEATYNPLNTTKRLPGSTLYRSSTHGVQNYATPNDGVAATIATLRNGKYEPILALLRADATPTRVAKAILASTWGTKRLLLDVLAMYARGKVVVAPIAAVPGGPAPGSVEPTLSRAPEGTTLAPRPSPRPRRPIPTWIWWTAGGIGAVGLALWLGFATRRRAKLLPGVNRKAMR